MELNQLTKTMTELCGGIEPEHIMAALTGPDREQILQGYRDQVGMLEYDHLRECWEYWHHKAASGQFFTPPTLCKLAAAMTDCGGGTVMDICAGSGSMTIAKWVQNPDRVFVCIEKDRDLIPYLLFNLCVRRMRAWVRVGDALGEIEETWKVEPDQMPRKVDEKPLAEGPVEVVSNPPYNMPWSGECPPLAGWPKIPKGNANYAFVMACLVGAKAAVILPASVLQDKLGAAAREYIVSAGALEHVIRLPENLFENTPVATCMLILSRGNTSVKVTDLSGSTATESRDRKGMYGGKSHEGRTYHKLLATITDEMIEQCKSPDGRYLTFAEIEQHGYSLDIRRYQEYHYERPPHRPISDIMDDLNRISREKSMIKVTINEPFARTLGIPEAMEGWPDQDEWAKGMQELFEEQGKKYYYRRYITLTRSRELKIEAQDRDEYSHLWSSFLLQWAYHLRYLMQQEMRLLTELEQAHMIEDFS